MGNNSRLRVSVPEEFAVELAAFKKNIMVDPRIEKEIGDNRYINSRVSVAVRWLIKNYNLQMRAIIAKKTGGSNVKSN